MMLFVVVASPVSAQGIQWSTYVGSPGLENPLSTATDTSGNIYLLGRTKFQRFPGNPRRFSIQPWKCNF